MQCGEASSGGDDWKLVGEILEVTFDSGIKAAHAKAEITPPHWKKGEDYYGTEDFSSRAAVILCDGAKKSKESKPVKLKIEITENENVPAEAELTGLLDSLEIEAKIPTAVGTHDVEAEIKELPEGILRANGSICWVARIKGEKGQASLGETKVEVFGVVERPAFVFASAPGVWTEALRFLCTKVGILGFDDETEILATTATYLHGAHGLDYDHKIGDTAYLAGLDTFQLADYITLGQGSTVNCHDQAAAVHLFAAAVGVEADRQFLGPFGYINATSLVGSPPCNNPFYADPSLVGTGLDNPLIDPSSPQYIDRTLFGNHGFVERKKRVFDACAGPGVGAKRKAYLRTAIDRESHKLAEKAGRNEPYGRPGDVTEWPPIGSVT